MFSIFSKTKRIEPESVYGVLGTDMHSHLVPGVDDGARDLATAVKLVKGMLALGYKKLITTPHILRDMYPNTPESIGGGLKRLQEELDRESIPVSIRAAAEYFLDDHVAELLQNKEPLLTLDGTMVLSEFSMAYQPHGIRDILFEMQMQGYQPVIAHPERYIYLQQNREFFDELKEAGCLFQLNILSLGGGYGRSVQELAQYLLKKNYYDLLGTDLHHGGHLEALRDPALLQQLKKLLDSGKFLNTGL